MALRAKLRIIVTGVPSEADINFNTPDGNYLYQYGFNGSDISHEGGVSAASVAGQIYNDLNALGVIGFYGYGMSRAGNLIEIIAPETGTVWNFSPAFTTSAFISLSAFFDTEIDPGDPSSCFVSVVSVGVVNASNNNTFDGTITINAETDAAHTLEFLFEQESVIPLTIPFTIRTAEWQSGIGSYDATRKSYTGLKTGTYKIKIRNTDETCEREVSVFVGVEQNTFTATASYTAMCPYPLTGSKTVTKTYTSSISFLHAYNVALSLATQEAENGLSCDIPAGLFYDLENEVYVQGRTMAYSVKRNQFIGEMSFNPEMYSHIDEQLVSFKDGKPWLHERGTSYNVFYGKKYSSEIMFYLNNEPFWEKFLQSIHLNLNMKSPSVQVTATSREADGSERQRTDIRPTEFKYRRDMWAAPFKRDLLSPGELIKEKQLKITHGRKMRDQLFEIAIKTSSNIEWLLKGAYIMWEKVSMWGTRKRDAGGTPQVFIMGTTYNSLFTFNAVGDGSALVQWAEGRGSDLYVVGEDFTNQYEETDTVEKTITANFYDGASIIEIYVEREQQVTFFDSSQLTGLVILSIPDNDIATLPALGKWIQNELSNIDLSDNRMDVSTIDALLDHYNTVNESFSREPGTRMLNLLGQFGDLLTSPPKALQLEGFGTTVLLDYGPSDLEEDTDYVGSEIALKWVDYAISNIEFEIYRSINVDVFDPANDAELLDTVPKATTTYVDSDFSIGGEYFYYIRAKSKKNFSPFVKIGVYVGEYTIEYTTDFNA